MVEDQLRRRVRRQRQRVHGNVRQRNRMHKQQVAAAPAGDVVDQALERVPVIERLSERIARPLPAAITAPQPLAVAALQITALDLQANDPVVGMGEHEVDLTVARTLSRIASHPADRMEHLPGIVKPALERVEDLCLTRALDIVVQQGARIHPGHTRPCIGFLTAGKLWPTSGRGGPICDEADLQRRTALASGSLAELIATCLASAG